MSIKCSSIGGPDLPTASSGFREDADHLLVYTVHSWSSYSPNYHPLNILEDNPSNQSSRWSSDTNFPPQFVCLKLSKPAVVNSITFGKYEKTHVCNLRKFTVYGGLSLEHMIELLTDGLKNDNIKETFQLRREFEGHRFPCLYLKIVPILSWGPSFNFSIWHVALRGFDEPHIVKPCLKRYSKFREQKAIRLCLKHFRQKNYMEAYHALQKKTKIMLEHPMVSELHEVLVRHGDFENAEAIIEKAVTANLFQQYISAQVYKPTWTPIVILNQDGDESFHQPGMRGGHQMCIDQDEQLIYLLGGWDGTKDLTDFWVFSIQHEQWHCLSEDTAAAGGPSGRSCHKICLDTKRRAIYVLGRYLDAEARTKSELNSDFFRYDLDSGLWAMISYDTASENGPHLIYDHQMIYDYVSDKLFVFGGRILNSMHPEDNSPIDVSFSGLFSYHIPSNKWEKIRDDDIGRPVSGPMDDQSFDGLSHRPTMKSRIGHSMLFDEKSRLLYVFAGQRGRENLNDFFSYNIETGEICSIMPSTDNEEVPSSGFTQRSTIDTELQEIYVLSGLSKDKEKKEDTIRNSFWVFHVTTRKWCCLYRNDNYGQQYWSKMQNVEPCPRFAHQLVYDQRNKIHYLFGGNPGKSLSLKMRLDDFWKLKLERISAVDLARKCKYTIRKLRYRELTERNAMDALPFLQNDLAELVDHGNAAEREEFESLATSLFARHHPHSSDEDDTEDFVDHEGWSVPRHVYRARSRVFDELVAFFPKEMTQPTGNLVDLVSV